MKVLLPENISDITVEQYQGYIKILEKDIKEEELKREVISNFTDLPLNIVESVSQKDINDMFFQITSALKQEVDFVNTFSLDGVEYGFIPNLDLISGAEWVDLSKYQTDTENYHRLLAILFRPITKKDSFGNYKIKKYKGTSEYADKMKKTPLNIINGALVFFYNLANELEISTQKSITLARVKAQTQ